MKLHMMRLLVAPAAIMLVLLLSSCCSGANGFAPRTTTSLNVVKLSSIRNGVLLPLMESHMARMTKLSHPEIYFSDESNVVMNPSNHLKTIHEISIPQGSKDPKPMQVNMWQKTMGDFASKRTIPLLLAIVFAVAMVSVPLPSEAAMSGGRLGGSFSSYSSRSSSSSSSWSSPSRGYSSPSSYSSGFSRSSSTRYYSSPTSSFTRSSSYGGYHSPLYSPLSPLGGFGCPSNPAISPFSPFCSPHWKHGDD